MMGVYLPPVSLAWVAFSGLAEARKLQPSLTTSAAPITATVSDVDPGKRILLERSSTALWLPTSLRQINTQAGEANQSS